MKKNFSLFLASMLFISHSLLLAKAPEEVYPVAEALEDYRLSMAQDIEKYGEYLQKIQDEQSIEAAHLIMENSIENVQGLYSNLTHKFEQMSEADANIAINNMKQHMGSFGSVDSIMAFEKMNSILIDRASSSKQKLETLLKLSSEEYAVKAIQAVQQRANEVGYAKVFNDAADLLRSRSWFQTRTLEDKSLIWVILGVTLLVTFALDAPAFFNLYMTVGALGMGIIAASDSATVNDIVLSFLAVFITYFTFFY